MRRLGEILLERGLVSAADLAAAAATQRALGGFLGPALVRLGALGEDDWLALAAELSGLAILPADRAPAPGDAIAAAERLGASLDWLKAREAVVWFGMADGAERLHLAARHPFDPALLEAAEHWRVPAACRFLATAEQLARAFGDGAPAAEAGGPLDPARLRELAEEAPVIDFVNAALAEAVAREASDIHFEAYEAHFAVRLRVDGALREWRRGPRSAYDAIASRVKLLSGLDIAERRLPQDGRQSVRAAGRSLDLRVSSLPSSWGESIVLRLLDKAARLPNLAELGLDGAGEARLRAMVGAANGLVLVTGPTGSGKTTTVYRLLSDLNDGRRKIVTIEDPVEIDLPGVTQMRVRAEIGLGFAEGLRAILRQDPDVILVGEIRDAATARIAVQAALTGHLVIATIHTKSALGAPARLVDLGVEPFLAASALRGLIGQRLMRRVCPRCAAPIADEAGAALIRSELAAPPPEPPRLMAGTGCAHCAGEGDRGRIAAFEVATVTPDLAAAIRVNAAEPALEALARADGFKTLREDALAKAWAGSARLEEALRAAGGG